MRQGSCAADARESTFQGVAQFPVRSTVKSSHASFSSSLSGIAANKSVPGRTTGPATKSRPATGLVGYYPYPEEEKRMVPKGDTSDDFISEEGFTSHRHSPASVAEIHVKLDIEH